MDNVNQKKTVLITGVAGFIGHHLLEGVLKQTDWDVVGLDGLTYAGNLNRISDIGPWAAEQHRFKFVWHDLRAPLSETIHKMIGSVDYVWHLAAESHIDKSLEDSVPFIMSNVLGTANILEYVKHYQPKLEKFVQFSCYDEKTRALTKNGFKNYWEIREGDAVLSINPKTREIEEKRVEKIIIQDYKGEMYHFENSRIDLMVTSNHRVFYTKGSAKKIMVDEASIVAQKTASYLPWGEWDGVKNDFIQPAGLGKVSVQDLFYLSGVFIGDGFVAHQKKIVPSKSGLTKKERDILAKDKSNGRFIATGIIGDQTAIEMNSWRIFFDVPEKDKARKKLEAVLKRLNIDYSRHKGKAGEHIYFCSKKWCNFFTQFGQRAENKNIPEWMLKYNKKSLAALFDGLIDSDGYWGKSWIQYTTVSEKLVKDICELGFKLGYHPTFKNRRSETIFQGRVIEGSAFYVYFPEKPIRIGRDNVKRELYNGKIWCLRVKDNKNFIVERNGKLAFCGNTDEVYGAAPDGVFFKEDAPLKPSNPYSASKAGADMMAYTFGHAFNTPVITTRSMNVFGERQYPEKFIPKTVKAILENRKVVIHGSPGEVSFRFWIHARNVADFLIFLMEKGKIKETYNIVGVEKSVLDAADRISQIIKGRSLAENEIEYVRFHDARPGHDRRYALDGAKARELGWEPKLNFEESFDKMIRWMIAPPNRRWLNL